MASLRSWQEYSGKSGDLGQPGQSPVIDRLVDQLMDFAEVTPDRFVVEFHYCPLTTAWQKQGCGEQEIAKLCDIAMDGDRGMTSTCPGFKMDLVSIIASGAPVCRIVFTRKK